MAEVSRAGTVVAFGLDSSVCGIPRADASLVAGMQGSKVSATRRRINARRVLSAFWRKWIYVGLAALLVGMCVLPALPSLTPRQPFQYLVGVTLYLPVLLAGASQPRRWWMLIQRPLMPWVLALMGWAAISLSWTNADRPLEELLILPGILCFLFAWHHAVGNDEKRLHALLFVGACVLAAVGAVALARFIVAPPVDGRMIGFGVMANANLIAAGMAAGVIWLWPWQHHRLRWRVLKWLVLAILAVCLSQTFSRSVWAALLAALMTLSLLSGSRHSLLAASLFVGGALATAAAYPALTARGWSHRPELFDLALGLFRQHPWTGMGFEAEFVISAHGVDQVHTHNLFTQLAVELGLPGLLLWSVTWLLLGYRGWQWRNTYGGQVVLGLWVFATILVQFDLPQLLDSPRPGWLILWLPLAISLSFPSRRES